MSISEQEKRYFGEEPQAEREPVNIWLGRRLMRIAEAHPDEEARQVLYTASGYIAASKPKA